MDHRHVYDSATPQAEHVTHQILTRWHCLPACTTWLMCLYSVPHAACPPLPVVFGSKHLTPWHAGDVLDVKVHRKGEEVALRYRLHQRRPLVPVLHGVDCVPSYLIIGGLVFVPLSIPFLEHAYGGALALSPCLHP